jgi:cell filamentation protein
MNAMIQSAVDARILRKLLNNALTDEIDSREMYMKGIDHSYYYEEE